MAKLLTITSVSALLVTLASCGNVDYQETTKSAAAGAAVGAGANYLAGVDPYEGAVIGAVGGAALEASGIRDNIRN